MNLYEYQAKKLFSKFNLPVLKNWVCSNISDIKHCFSSITDGPPWIVKCQILSGSRGQSGGVRIVHSLEDILRFANQWIGKKLITCQTETSGEIVNHILIEPAVKIVNEFYLSVLVDRDLSQIVCMASTKGGIDVEKVIHKSPDLIYKTTIDPIFEVYPYQGRIIACKLGLTGIQINQFVKTYINIIRMFFEKDLMLVEINPLVITNDHQLFCLDAKVTVDHNSLFRQGELLDLCDANNNKTDYSLTIGKLGINYVALNGDIGCMVNGAGLAMATMDLMQALGGTPANFLDIGGDTDKNCIVLALKMLLENTKIKAIFINIFGGIVCCDLVADSIIIAVSECMTNIPIVVRLEGNNATLGSNRLNSSHLNIVVINNLIHAIKQVIKLVK